MEAGNITIVINPAGGAGRDEAGRRAQIIGAAWAVIVQTGIGNASLRNIATAMQATTGLITRYFPDKQSLLLASLKLANETLIGAARAAGAGRQGLDQVQATLTALLPWRAGVQMAWRVWIAFLGELPGNADLAAAHNAFPEQLRRLLIDGLREAQREGQIKAQLYPPFIADAILNQLIAAAVRNTGDAAAITQEKFFAILGPFFSGFIKPPVS